MTVGRNDLVLIAPAGVPAGDVVLDVCRRRWPDGVFQDAGSDEIHSLSDPLWRQGMNSREFFVFKNRSLAETWDETGPVPENYNDFLHFLLQRNRNETAAAFELTIAFDQMDDRMRGFVDELRKALIDAAVQANASV